MALDYTLGAMLCVILVCIAASNSCMCARLKRLEKIILEAVGEEGDDDE